MKPSKLENTIMLMAWISGILVSFVVGYSVWSGAIPVPEILGGYLFSNLLGWTIIITTFLTVILSFFRK